MNDSGFVLPIQKRVPEVHEMRKKMTVNKEVIVADDMSAVTICSEEQDCRLLVEIGAKTGKPVSIVSKEVLSSESKNKRYELKKVSKDELKVLRKTSMPALIIKKCGICYWAELDKSCEKLDFMNHFKLGMMHYCASAGKECARLSAASDECGGCAKVRDRGNLKRIEKYSWITDGYQTLNMRNPVFFVSNCEHYMLAVRTSMLSREKISEMKLGIAGYMYPEIDGGYSKVHAKKNSRGLHFPAMSKYSSKRANQM